MKKLITLLLGLRFITAAAGFEFEKDPFKYIPEGANLMAFDMNGNGIYDFFWYDKNKDGIMQDDERFYDLNEDGIPDISHKEIIKMYKDKYDKLSA